MEYGGLSMAFKALRALCLGGELFLLFLLLPLELHSEFYKYIDKDGKICFVDDESKIPRQYRDSKRVYREKCDNLSAKERSLMLEKERKERELLRKQEDEWLAEEKERQEQIAREKYLKSLVTKVTIRGNQVLVPATLGYGGKEIEGLFILDTGAELTTVHREIADKLSIGQSKKIRVQVAGGRLIRAHLAKLDYMKVGPYKKQDMHIIIIGHKGPSVTHDGLLGMNFLRNLDYRIDFGNHLIQWKP
jgi:predicted aspartyl protease